MKDKRDYLCRRFTRQIPKSALLHSEAKVKCLIKLIKNNGEN